MTEDETEYDKLARQFKDHCIETACLLARETVYKADRFLVKAQPMTSLEFVRYVTHLVTSPGEGEYGYRKLIELHREQHTLEYEVARVARWEPLFSHAVREGAEFRLHESGVSAT